jgi:methylmalonyl-CoA mutase
MEGLTDGLCEAAWKEFQAIEAEGGILASLADGHVQNRVVGARDERARRYGDGGRQIVGTTLHPQKDEKSVGTLSANRPTLPQDGAVSCQRLEAMRNDEALAGSR